MTLIPLHSRKYFGLYAKVDDRFANFLRQFRWNPKVDKNKDGSLRIYAGAYVRDSGGRRTWIQMHRLVAVQLWGSGDYEVDHKNGDGLDDQEANIRRIDPGHSGNCANKRKAPGISRFKGVIWSKQHNKWRTRITFQRKRYHLGLFTFEEDAARAYNRKAKELFGDFAKLNDVMPQF